MKYINTRYSLFDSCDFNRYFNDTDNGGGFCGGEGKITLPAETTKLYVSMELYTTGSSSSSCWPLQIYFSDGTYNTVKASTVQLYLDAGNNKLYLETNKVQRLNTPFTAKRWHKVYLAVDTTAGTIDYYVDGDKIGTYTDYVKTGVKAINCKIKLENAASSLYTKAKNIIISDEFFPMNETVVLIPSTVNANGWTYNNSDNKYSTETENSTLQVQPDLSGLNDYKITAVNVAMGTTTLGDTIQHIQCDMGTYSNTKEIPATNKGMYFDGLPKNISNITITAK
jgi:hypothetical protein